MTKEETDNLIRNSRLKLNSDEIERLKVDVEAAILSLEELDVFLGERNDENK